MTSIVNLISIQGDTILSVKRKKEPYKWMYWLPWWHVETWESHLDALQREIVEETNQSIKNINFVATVAIAWKSAYEVHLYTADIDWNNSYDTNDTWVEHASRIPIHDFINWLHAFEVAGREKLIEYIDDLRKEK